MYSNNYISIWLYKYIYIYLLSILYILSRYRYTCSKAKNTLRCEKPCWPSETDSNMFFFQVIRAVTLRYLASPHIQGTFHIYHYLIYLYVLSIYIYITHPNPEFGVRVTICPIVFKINKLSANKNFPFKNQIWSMYLWAMIEPQLFKMNTFI